MNDDLENELRAALRPVPPATDLSARIMAGIDARSRRRRGRKAWWATAGVAAALLLGVGLQQRIAQEHDREDGLRARRQLIEALQVTNQKLDLALRTVTEGSAS